MRDNTLLDKVLAGLSLFGLALYLGLLVWYVPQPALAAVSSLTVLLAGFDFVRTTFERGRPGRNQNGG